MFYVKGKIGDTRIEVELTAENVYTVCPVCGEEIQVDLSEVFKDENADFQSSNIFCDKECAAEYERNLNNLSATRQEKEVEDEGFATAKSNQPVTIGQAADFLNGKRFYCPGTVENEKGEEIGLSLEFFEGDGPEEEARRWSLHCLKDGTLQIVEW